MTDRPDLGVMWRTAFDEDTQRLRPEARYAVLHIERCKRAQHLQLVALRSPYGRWLAYRPMRRVRDVWGQSWLDEEGDSIEVTCHCDRLRRVDLSAVRAMH